jgi:hypothetical protein
MLFWIMVVLLTGGALLLERRRSAEFWARALQVHEMREKAWGAAATGPSSATIAAGRQQALRSALTNLRAVYPIECKTAGLLDPGYDQEFDLVTEITSTARYDPARVTGFAAASTLDVAHARLLQGGSIDWDGFLKWGGVGAVGLGIAGFLAGLVLSFEVRPQTRPLSTAGWGALIGFLAMSQGRDHLWSWLGDAAIAHLDERRRRLQPWDRTPY